MWISLFMIVLAVAIALAWAAVALDGYREETPQTRKAMQGPRRVRTISMRNASQ